MATIVTKIGNVHVKHTYDCMYGRLSQNNNRFIEVIELVKIEEEIQEVKRLLNINFIYSIIE